MCERENGSYGISRGQLLQRGLVHVRLKGRTLLGRLASQRREKLTLLPSREEVAVLLAAVVIVALFGALVGEREAHGEWLLDARPRWRCRSRGRRQGSREGSSAAATGSGSS